MDEYNQLEKPDKISDNSSRAYFDKERRFADEFYNSIMVLYPVDSELVYE